MLPLGLLLLSQVAIAAEIENFTDYQGTLLGRVPFLRAPPKDILNDLIKNDIIDQNF
jgi:hypothetical protein